MVALYHGSDVAIEAPDVSRNTGNADFGRGFYLTVDRDAPACRARAPMLRSGSRSRWTSAASRHGSAT